MRLQSVYKASTRRLQSPFFVYKASARRLHASILRLQSVHFAVKGVTEIEIDFSVKRAIRALLSWWHQSTRHLEKL